MRLRLSDRTVGRVEGSTGGTKSEVDVNKGGVNERSGHSGALAFSQRAGDVATPVLVRWKGLYNLELNHRVIWAVPLGGHQ